ncbi:hypothetical protein B0T24DRAFT_609418 [Lasiosphaeria ovina]|uniref:Formylmethionine deformylase-like protein n=1 Tax=Lasiosphaeria ovina TaxID=92902 RepID=A0AAE0KLW2_9PEZI|nr:hypothetical protein B0T24DRAFT_609418 [Lasiosphaeria ovina]
MYLLFMLGVAFAIAHHVYYNSLDGKPASDQLQMLRYGTLLAFAAKAGLCAAVVIAFEQRVWTTVRKRLMTVAALDSLFSAPNDLASLWNWELAKSARTAVSLAVFIWLAPLMVILTANTLLVEPATTVTSDMCPGIRTLNFAFEDTYEWRDPAKIGPLFESPLSFWNTTKPADSDPEGWFDYYTGPSPNFYQTASIGAFMGEAIMRKNAQAETCGSGWNCSFEIAFTGPGYKCTELASGVGVKPANLTQESGSIAPPFDTDIILPRGPYSYYAFTNGGEYSTKQMDDVGIGGIPKTPPPYPKHLGAFRTEPVVWIGYAVLADPNKPVPTNESDPAWASAFVPKLFACENYETDYAVVFNYTEGAQTTTVKNVTFLRPVVNTTFIPDIDADDGTADNTTAVPEDNYIYPNDVARYRRTAAYHSLSILVRYFLNGTVEMDKDVVNPIVNTNAIQTKLLDPRTNFFPYANLQDLVQRFYEDIILSILSTPHFAVVAWAARPQEQSGTLPAGTNGAAADYNFPCVKSRTQNQYKYHARDLWIVYGIAILLALVGVAAGALAVADNNGAVRDTHFSSVVAATRGPALDRARWDGGGATHYSTVPAEVKRLRAGYGLVGDVATPAAIGGELQTSGVRYGFGLEGDVRQLRRESSILRFSTAE